MPSASDLPVVLNVSDGRRDPASQASFALSDTARGRLWKASGVNHGVTTELCERARGTITFRRQGIILVLMLLRR